MSSHTLLLLLLRLTLLLFTFLAIISDGNESIAGAQAPTPPLSDEDRYNSVESLFGQVAKTVVYGGASLARFNSRLLCPLLSRETDKENQDEPTLFVFNDRYKREHNFRIYADDDITASMIEEAQFDPNQMTYIFVHGWLGGILNELWLSNAKNVAMGADSGLLPTNGPGNSKDGSHLFKPNVIIVDWSGFAQGSLYSATQNSFKVSRRLAHLLEQLANVGGLKPELMHCMGHSIGTHICGQAARYAFPAQPRPLGGQWQRQNGSSVLASGQRRFGRITGLDPGGFCYELGIRDESTYLGLKPSDALLVDAYYSNRSPFGNRHQVAHYNVRLNNGFFQKPCSVWRNPDVATAYFRAAVRFSLGNIGHNELLTCDHYFATRFTHQNPSPKCSFVAYLCDSYRNFIRGKCGLCERSNQCYPMDFEYQRGQFANVTHARDHLARYSSFNDRKDGVVAYTDRLTYYMHVLNEEPYCGNTFRIRVNLNRDLIDVGSFRPDWLRLTLNTVNGERLMVRDANVGWPADSISLYGPWEEDYSPEASNRPGKLQELFGVQAHTLTALFDLVDTKASNSSGNKPPIIGSVQVEYDNQLSRRQDPLANPVDSIELDYLSSSDSD